MIKLLLVIVIAVVYTAYNFGGIDQVASAKQSLVQDVAERATSAALTAGEQAISEAFQSRNSNVLVEATGRVVKVLADDNQGSRHQRFIVKLDNGITVLIAHNIDLASRIDSLKAGDEVAFKGEYAWNAKGGLVHWTHHDPQGQHVAGWLRHNGQTYQ
ncbi:MAG: DUF3465 domain-containing protein [Methylophilaceae bacterium]